MVVTKSAVADHLEYGGSSTNKPVPVMSTKKTPRLAGRAGDLGVFGGYPSNMMIPIPPRTLDDVRIMSWEWP